MMMKQENPTECYEKLKQDERSLLVDCRAEIEWTLLGTADLSEMGKKTLLVEWTNLANQRNPEFVNEIASYVSKDTPLIIMCRIGGRSAAAANALIEAGFSDVTNMAEGYEGRADEKGHRNSFEGWRARGLPWNQT